MSSSAPSSASPKTFRVKSFGCQMNVYDGERMAELLAAQGMSAAGDGDDADLVVLNTCHIREKATEKVYSDIGRLRRADGSAPLIAVAGCVAQAEGEEIMARAPSVKVVVGPQSYHRLPEMVADAAAGKRSTETDMPAEAKFAALPKRRKSAPTAFLTVQEGCDKFCTYCVVPYTRGAEISRPFSDLVEEAKLLVAGGAREITLLGQNVNAWAGEDDKGRPIGLDGLARALAAEPDLKRIRYTTSHPNDMTDGLIAAHGELEKLMPFLHLPVQAGNDRVLKAMNRSHTADSYMALLERIRAARPDIALSGDFIVGFPGETDAEFEDTLRLVDAVGYAQAFSFKYSARPGTPAATMENHVPVAVMDERLQRLQAALNRDQLAFNKASVGKTCEVLVERRGKHPGQWLGKSPWLQSVHFSGEAEIGDMVTVELIEAGPNSISGRLA
ncbi:tRNA-i(6)A37 thiotransferase enzyme MiaB [Novosphingobium aromaticivorans DSM 12444]|uniref:tRNA-2-methylthio-N(6)-dimethylallyladenosine synthase n=1 Tax=Novosphingobium aromaticivorans (strain ATCC 700278 / DSM 12444 / CCUG 56034 / CIP 105152 / NBRC 16084 / F199) TaxID=279238 RepID=MIAB_NOVAD|nr:tRNA (N6-isopentenyl adenosine(37)-C2)-methylthiotransferase MiaB [Novosphingobium aromaticivorans]Q2G9P6.1 RecName: Full=tRNA-2-methylthio-N(6)-dimethylallyladenosine synthase; AltName: Full=(Dimethylallyl)adenosine tRNA methylthiotransferase MiaB; AltName: Full=tRNA-i(6)A37 methylthiotransferase [Novosphingobium aromaticivorans DSM 12444]ABD25427.1 tRNA-i(6)A37 thiotransferase enzyme MiaB [Novosphingobium aromaticivorans DSM 12444]SCX93208.1 tRNA-i(6)A37 thiotransferase enzyme MiaB [Novosph